MNSIDNKYIYDGIIIRKKDNGYGVFTIQTQHFDIVNLDELTNERFQQEIEKYKDGEVVRLKFLKEFNQNKDEKDPKNKDGKDPNAIYDWGSFPLEKNFEWKNQNKEDE